MTSFIVFIVLSAVMWQGTAAPDISGQWTGDEWSSIVLEPLDDEPNWYTGRYVSAEGDHAGTLQLSWSRLQRRFNGQWKQSGQRYGDISIRVGEPGEIRGALTVDPAVQEAATLPRLRDFVWTRKQDSHTDPPNDVQAADQVPGTTSVEHLPLEDREDLALAVNPDETVLGDNIRTQRLERVATFVTSVEDRDDLRVRRERGGSVTIRPGGVSDTALIPLNELVTSVEYEIGEQTREIRTRQPFNYIFVAWPESGPITWVAYRSPETSTDGPPHEDSEDDGHAATPDVARTDMVGLLEGSEYLPTVLTHRVHELGLEHVITLVRSLKGNEVVRVPTDHGFVVLRPGEARLMELNRPVDSTAWYAGDERKEIRAREPFNYLLAIRPKSGPITWAAYQSTGLWQTAESRTRTEADAEQSTPVEGQSSEEAERASGTSDTAIGESHDTENTAERVATRVAEHIEELKSKFSHLENFSAAEHLSKNEAASGYAPGTPSNPELNSIGYSHGILGREPAAKSGPKKSAEFMYDQQKGIQLHVHFFKGDSRGADLTPPYRIGELSIHVYVKGPAAAPIRREIVRVLEEIGSEISLAKAEAPDPQPTDDGHRPASSLSFSETKGVVLSMNSMKYMLDLDTGNTMDPPARTGRPEQKQMDVRATQMQPYQYPTGLTGLSLRGLKVKSSDWHASAWEVHQALHSDKVQPLSQMDYAPGETTYVFRTREGRGGILQLLALDEEPKGIRIRYKTVEAPAAVAPATEGEYGDLPR